MNRPGMNFKIILKPIMEESIFSSITQAYWRPKQLRISRRHPWRNGEPVNVEGVFMGCRMAVKIMKDAGGSIVNISSTAGIVGSPMLVAYGASKGAVRILTKGVALHCARQRYHIRCNSVHPGPIETDMGDSLLGLQNFIDGPNLESKWETMRRRIPTGNTGLASDVASCILFLASDDSIHMTGSELVVDGGMTAN